MRWALFPALAGLAGAVGGELGAKFGGWGFNLDSAVLPGALGAAAAFASGLTSRYSTAFLVAPPLGIFAILSAFAVLRAAESGRLPDPGLTLLQLTQQGGTIPLLCSTAFLQTVIHRATRGWPVVLATGTGAALLVYIFAMLLNSNPLYNSVLAAVWATSTLAQVPAVLAARAVARPLRPPEAA